MTEIEPTRDLQEVVHQKVGAHLQDLNNGDMDSATKNHKTGVIKKAHFRQTAAEDSQPHDPNAPTRGFDLQFMVNVDFVTVALGGTIPYSYEKYVRCENCDSTGESEEKTCTDCEGKRQVVRKANLKVKIPPGVADQYVIRLQHEGGEGINSGPPGDLFLKVCTKPHPIF